MTVDWSSNDRYRYTLTLTPMTEDDIQAVLDDIRTRFGRAPLVHVIDKRDSHSHLDDVRPQAEGAGETDEQQCQAWAGSEHVYLSTGCLHGEHGYCQAMTGQQGEKRPGRCKFCDARCVCPCHGAAGETDEAAHGSPS